MIALVVVVLAVLVVTAIVWARVVSARSATKSVETYERALGVLGEVSKRTESTGFRILPHEETGRPHVGRRVDEAGEGAPFGASRRSHSWSGPPGSLEAAAGRRAQASLLCPEPARPAARSGPATER